VVVLRACEAQRDDQLRHLRARIDDHADAVDLGLAPGAVLDVFHLQLAAELQELEARADLEAGGAAALLDSGFHRRAKAIDVQAHPRTDWASGGARSGLGVLSTAQLAQRFDALAVESGELDPEFTPTAVLLPPGDHPFDQDLAAAVLEAAHQRIALVRQVGGAKVHSAGAHVHGLGFEDRDARHVANHFHEGGNQNASRAEVTAL
jgi:hypothetical protein